MELSMLRGSVQFKVTAGVTDPTPKSWSSASSTKPRAVAPSHSSSIGARLRPRCFTLVEIGCPGAPTDTFALSSHTLAVHPYTAPLRPACPILRGEPGPSPSHTTPHYTAIHRTVGVPPAAGERSLGSAHQFSHSGAGVTSLGQRRGRLSLSCSASGYTVRE